MCNLCKVRSSGINACTRPIQKATFQNHNKFQENQNMLITERVLVRTQPLNWQVSVTHFDLAASKRCACHSPWTSYVLLPSDGSDRSKVRHTTDRLLPISYLWLTFHSFTTTPPPQPSSSFSFSHWPRERFKCRYWWWINACWEPGRLLKDDIDLSHAAFLSERKFQLNKEFRV